MCKIEINETDKNMQFNNKPISLISLGIDPVILRGVVRAYGLQTKLFKTDSLNFGLNPMGTPVKRKTKHVTMINVEKALKNAKDNYESNRKTNIKNSIKTLEDLKQKMLDHVKKLEQNNKFSPILVGYMKSKGIENFTLENLDKDTFKKNFKKEEFKAFIKKSNFKCEMIDLMKFLFAQIQKNSLKNK